MVTVTPALQIGLVDPATVAQSAQAGGQGLPCLIGSVLQEAVLAAHSSGVALPFPIGVSTAVVIFISAVAATDLVVNIGSGSPIAMSIPAYQGTFLYGLTSAQISVSSVLGGKIQYAIGG